MVAGADRDAVQIEQPDDDSRVGSVVVAFPQAKAGDILIVSIQTHSPAKLGWVSRTLMHDYPVALASLRLSTSRTLEYGIYPVGLAKGTVQRKTYAEHRGRTQDVQLTTSRIPARRTPSQPRGNVNQNRPSPAAPKLIRPVRSTHESRKKTRPSRRAVRPSSSSTQPRGSASRIAFGVTGRPGAASASRSTSSSTGTAPELPRSPSTAR